MGNQHSAGIDDEKSKSMTLSSIIRLPSGSIDSENLFPQWNNRVAKEVKFIKQLGKGGFGKVWSCQRLADGADGPEIACKIVDKSKMKPATLTHLHDEIEFMEKLEHKGIVKFYGGYETRKKLYMLLEECTGGELLARIGKLKQVPSDKVIYVLRQMLEVIAYCHSFGVIHCDLKPENVLFVEKNGWEIKIIDFGLSKVRRKHEWLSKIGGTPYYVAPECLKKRYTDSVDMYAIGIMTFELLYGYLPFEGTPNDPLSPIKQARKGLQNVTKHGKGPWFNSKYNIPESAKDFIINLVSLKPAERMTAKEALAHPFLNDSNKFNIHSFVLLDLGKKHAMSTLQKFLKDTIHDPSHNLNPWMMKEMKQEFKKYAGDDNLLTFDEFSKAMKKISSAGEHMDEYELHEVFDNMDIDGDHTINIDEFLKWCSYEHASRQDDRLWDMVKQLDINGDGCIELEEIEKLVRKNPMVLKHLGQESIKEIQSKLKNGPMKIEDFICMMDTPKSESF